MIPAVLVVPCYNEEHRLQSQRFIDMLEEDPDLTLVFVDDGSKDGTHALIQSIAATQPRVVALGLPANAGKAEAVRTGMRHALQLEPSIIGFADADLSTPPAELLRLLAIARRRTDVRVVIGARVAMAGRRIERDPLRHYLGRIFSTLASLALSARIYDTQCGAKFLRNDGGLAHILQEPFLSRWVFDVEMLGRLLIGSSEVPPLAAHELLEVPLDEWVDPGGSKVTPREMARSALELVLIARDLRRRRRQD